ncbi:MAG: hypothetical protein JNM27_03390 [Leptospirales bacterium]|nr:hypothetical protein [Leptospirales bacterium]
MDSLLARALLRNGLLLILPPMTITFGLWAALPPSYAMDRFWKEIPPWLALPENILRILVFALPAFLYFGRKEKKQALGWFLYPAGLLIYLASYLAQIFFADSAWSRSAIGFTAPAWSTSIWFGGIGLVCKDTWLPLAWNRAVYLICCGLFLIFHIAHTALVFTRLS